MLRSVVLDGASTLAAGVALGLFVAWMASGVFASVVFGVAPTEFSVYASVAAIAAAAGLAAALAPAVRAARVDPMSVLRQG